MTSSQGTGKNFGGTCVERVAVGLVSGGGGQATDQLSRNVSRLGIYSARPIVASLINDFRRD